MSWTIEIVDGDVGANGSEPTIALDTSGYPHIVYRDDNNQLNYTKWGGSNWVQADGTSGTELVDSVGWGNYTTLVLDTSGNAYIAYDNASSNDLKFTKWDGSQWVHADGTIGQETVDSFGSVGTHPSLALDTSGNPHIISRGYTGLKFTKWDGSQWAQADGTAGLEIVDSDQYAGEWSTIALDTSGNPHIGYKNAGSNVKYTKWDGSNWVKADGTSGLEVVVSFGSYTSLALDDSDNPHIAYTAYNLSYTKWDGSNWVQSDGTSGQEVIATGSIFHKKIVIDTSNNPHIVYTDTYIDDTVKYTKWDGSNWVQADGTSGQEIVDTVGAYIGQPSIALDTSGSPHISFYNQVGFSGGELKYAIVRDPITSISANLSIPALSVTGVGVLSFTADPQDSLDAQLVGEPKVDNWAYDLDLEPLTKGDAFNEHVINISIENILSTLRGERLFNENFGSILPLVLFNQINYNSAFDLLESLLTSIRRFEKRITVIKDQVELNVLTNDNAFTIVIPYIINRTGLINSFAKKVVL